MHALWNLLTFAMSSWINAKDKIENWCEGFLQAANTPNQDKIEDAVVLLEDISKALRVLLLRTRR